MTESVVFYQSFHNATKTMLSPEHYGLFYFTLNEYAFNGVEPPEDLPPMVKMAFELCRPQIDAAKENRTKSKGGAPSGNQNASKKEKIPSAEEAIEETSKDEEKSNPDTVQETTEKQLKTTSKTTQKTTKTTPNYNLNDNSNLNANENGNINGNLNALGSEAKKASGEAAPPSPLQIVEQQYLQNYKELYEQGLLKLKEPKVNYAKTRKLINDNLKFYTLERVQEALSRSKTDDFCINKGYSLDLIMSSGVMNALINQNEFRQKPVAAGSGYLPEGHLIF